MGGVGKSVALHMSGKVFERVKRITEDGKPYLVSKRVS